MKKGGWGRDVGCVVEGGGPGREGEGTKCKERKCNSHKKKKKSQIMIKKKSNEKMTMRRRHHATSHLAVSGASSC